MDAPAPTESARRPVHALAEKIEDVFLKIRSGIDLSLVKERSCAARFDLARNLFRNPGVLAAVAHKNEPSWGVAVLFCQSGFILSEWMQYELGVLAGLIASVQVSRPCLQSP